ncbi:MAG: hypothetical protein ACRDHD_07155 [Candidatus Limnocylindria bacterium]
MTELPSASPRPRSWLRFVPAMTLLSGDLALAVRAVAGETAILAR